MNILLVLSKYQSKEKTKTNNKTTQTNKTKQTKIKNSENHIVLHQFRGAIFVSSINNVSKRSPSILHLSSFFLAVKTKYFCQGIY